VRTECPRCGAVASVTLAGEGYRIRHSNDLHLRCLVIRERAAQPGGTSDFTCPHLEKAAQEAVRQLRRLHE
jgi:hypothetical protein